MSLPGLLRRVRHGGPLLARTISKEKKPLAARNGRVNLSRSSGNSRYFLAFLYRHDVTSNEYSMGKLVLSDLDFDIPTSWQDQGMVTLTIPSTDKNVRPNIIITKERLTQAVDLPTYFAKIKEAVKARGITTFQILDERQISVGGVP